MSNRAQPPNLFETFLESAEIRRVRRDDQTWYSIVDIVRLLGDTDDPQHYWEDMKAREPLLARGVEVMEFEAADLMGVMRIIQSIPTQKAERYKRWLAESGRQRIEELENPELAILRTRNTYEQRGYDRRWIDKRLRGIAARHELTAEWYKRGAKESEQYRGLTNQLMQAAFGMDVEGYRRYKHLVGRQSNLRDHMSDMELVLTMLGETTAALLHRQRNSRDMEKLQADAQDAGQIVAHARQEIERRSGQAVVNPGNYLERSATKTHPG